MAIAHRASNSVANASLANIAIVIPASAVVDDIALAWWWNDTAVTVTGTPSGWTQIIRVVPANGTVFVYYKRLVAGEPGSTVTFSWATADWRQGGCSTYSGCVTTGNPQDAVATSTIGNSTAITHPSITTVSANAMLIAIGGHTDLTGTHTSGSGMTERTDVVSGAVYDLVQATAGASGDKTTNMSNVATPWGGVLLALTPASPSPFPTVFRQRRIPTRRRKVA